MVLKIKLAANSQGYLDIVHEGLQDRDDIVKWSYNYLNPSAFPAAWAYWKLDAGTWLDSSGNNRTLTPAGSTPPNLDSGMAHFVGDASLQNRLELAECWNPAGDKKFTYSFWVKSPPVTGSSYSSFILSSNLSVTIQGAYGFYGVDGLIVTVNTEDPWNLWISGDSDVYLLPPNTLSHFFIVYDGVGLYVYVDNVLVTSALGTHGMTSNMNIVKFGYPDATSLESWVKRFGIWEVALTSDQRAQLWNSGTGWDPRWVLNKKNEKI